MYDPLFKMQESEMDSLRPTFTAMCKSNKVKHNRINVKLATLRLDALLEENEELSQKIHDKYGTKIMEHIDRMDKLEKQRLLKPYGQIDDEVERERASKAQAKQERKKKVKRETFLKESKRFQKFRDTEEKLLSTLHEIDLEVEDIFDKS